MRVRTGLCVVGLLAIFALSSALSAQQPRGAFLGAEQGQSEQLSMLWFWAGAYVLVGLLFAALCAHRAMQSGHNPFAWFAAGLLLNIIAYLVLLSRPRRKIAAPSGVPPGLGKIHATREPEPCPHCGAMNHPAANQCLACGAVLTPHAVSEARAASLPAEVREPSERTKAGLDVR